MKSILGFSIGGNSDNTDVVITPKETGNPVRSLVSVRFIGDGRAFTYYNDKFSLEVGDHVFVSGKLTGKLGVVEKVTTKFKINLADYQRVISKASDTIHGTFESIMDKMVSFDRDAMTPDDFRSWVMPPRHWDDEEDKEEIVAGDGYELSLSGLEKSDEVIPSVLERAVDYCRSGQVAYISVVNGIGTAFINGTTWYEVNFRLRGDMITEMYCDCPYPGLCKHLLAVALTIRAMAKVGQVDTDRNFVAIDGSRFWSMVAHTKKRITL